MRHFQEGNVEDPDPDGPVIKHFQDDDKKPDVMIMGPGDPFVGSVVEINKDSEMRELRTTISLMKEHIGEHYFTPQDDNNRFCGRCGLYLTDNLHKKTL